MLAEQFATAMSICETSLEMIEVHGYYKKMGHIIDFVEMDDGKAVSCMADQSMIETIPVDVDGKIQMEIMIIAPEGAESYMLNNMLGHDNDKLAATVIRIAEEKGILDHPKIKKLIKIIEKRNG